VAFIAFVLVNGEPSLPRVPPQNIIEKGNMLIWTKFLTDNPLFKKHIHGRNLIYDTMTCAFFSLAASSDGVVTVGGWRQHSNAVVNTDHVKLVYAKPKLAGKIVSEKVRMNLPSHNHEPYHLSV